MNEITYPALYKVASEASARAQSKYLWLIRLEYSALFLTAVLAMDFSKSPTYLAVYAGLFILALAFLLYRSSSKPEQDWYKSRALAESVKTSTWRYAMKAEPYGSNDPDAKTRQEFREALQAILKANEFLGQVSSGRGVADVHVTTEMEGLRALAWEERSRFYQDHRIREQRQWYKNKATKNRDAARVWTGIGVIVYLVAIGCVLGKIARPDVEKWPEEPLIAIASALVGWVQIKKFRELASSYSLTSLEIGLIEDRLHEITTEPQFVDFVNEAEQGFSREHTQWIARQQHSPA